MNELYFISILANASKQHNQKQAWLEALEKIKMLGQQSEYRDGYKQFLLFMKEIENHCSLLEPFGLEKEQYEELYQEFQALQVEDETLIHWQDKRSIKECLPTLVIKCNEKIIEEIHLPPSSSEIYINGIEQGHYSIQFNTERILEDFHLVDKDIIWSVAFPDTGFPMAADYKKIDSLIGFERILLDGEINVTVLRGLKAGRMRLSFQREKQS